MKTACVSRYSNTMGFLFLLALFRWASVKMVLPFLLVVWYLGCFLIPSQAPGLSSSVLSTRIGSGPLGFEAELGLPTCKAGPLPQSDGPSPS